MKSRRPLWQDALLGITVGVGAFVCLAFILLTSVFVLSPDRIFSTMDQALEENPPQPAPVAEVGGAASPTPLPTKTPFPQYTLTIRGGKINVVEHLLLEHPVAENAKGNVPDWYYLYGNTQRGKLAVHHGVEFVNPLGTPLIAVADGEVVVAGTDTAPRCGEGGNELCGAQPDYYGKLVVLQLDETVEGQPLYVLYGHMDTVEVQVGQHVKTGERIGTIGATGVALGPHVHFEVRYGENSFASTRNPLLWLKPWPGHGSLAGRVVDTNGNPIRGAVVYVSPTEGGQMFTESYGADQMPAVNGDETMAENFAMGDLPAGEYELRVVIRKSEFKQTVTIEDGKLTYVVLGGAK